MDALETIKTRTSSRSYLDKPIPNEELMKIVRAGLEAPSARNYRPFRLHIIKTRKILDHIASLSPTKAMLHEAPVAILVSGDIEIQNIRCYLHQDCSALTQNMMLAAHSLGIGSCWLGIQDESSFQSEISSLLKLPPNLIPISFVALGYVKDRSKPKKERYLEKYYKIIE